MLDRNCKAIYVCLGSVGMTYISNAHPRQSITKIYNYLLHMPTTDLQFSTAQAKSQTRQSISEQDKEVSYKRLASHSSLAGTSYACSDHKVRGFTEL